MTMDIIENDGASQSGSAKDLLKEFKEKTKVDAEVLIKEIIPQRIFELNKVLTSPLLSIDPKDFHEPVNVPRPPPGSPAIMTSAAGGDSSASASRFLQTGEIQGTKLLALPDGVVQVNSKAGELHEVLKPLVTQLIDDYDLLKMWIHLQIPKVEDGNNFGVEIQEECLAEIMEIQKYAVAYHDQVTKYHLVRGKAVARVAKYPHVDDFRRAVEELDEKQLFTIQLTLKQLRNDYCLCHDIVLKNLEKIKRPRSSNAQNLY